MNTFFAIMAEFETADIPLEKVCEKYFGMDPKQAIRKASTQQLPVPVYKGGSQKSQWLLSAKDLADHMDARREQAKKDHRAMNA